MSRQSLDELAQRARAGDRLALAELFAALRPHLQPLLRRYDRRGAEGPLEPQDLAQQAYLIVADLACSWQGRGPFLAWCLHVFPLALLAYRRSLLRWDGPVVESLPPVEMAALLEEQATAAEPDLCDVVYCRQLLATLSPAHRRLLRWRYGDGLTYREIERLHGIAASTARAHCERALVFLRATARGEAPPPLPTTIPRTGRAPDAGVALALLWSLAGADGLLPPAPEAAAALGLGRRAYEGLIARLRETGCLGRAGGVAFASHHGRRWRLAVDLAEARRRIGGPPAHQPQGGGGATA